jgi:photosystem II stability/assembly factor-like uncharacterized protein
MRRVGTALIVVLAMAIPGLAISDSDPWWSVQTSGTDSNLRGVSVVYDTTKDRGMHYIIWASGSDGAILRSANDGKTWTQLHVPGGGDLDFRDIEAFDANTAYVMSSGDGEKSRIYKTNDGGQTWTLQYSDKRKAFFLDSLACVSEKLCFALSDPVDGKFLVLHTNDGEHWSELPHDNMPSALPREGAFAASGTSIALCEHVNIYFGTGGGGVARVFRSQDRGLSWKTFETPIVAGNASSGIFSIACDGSNIVAVGGDYREPNMAKSVAAYSRDDGETWHLAEQQPGGYRSAVATFSGDFVTVGTNGTDIHQNAGKEEMRWQHTDRLNLNAIAFDGNQAWAVGPKGSVARFHCHYQYEVNNQSIPSPQTRVLHRTSSETISPSCFPTAR